MRSVSRARARKSSPAVPGTLLLIDNEPLQDDAWKRLLTARRRLSTAAGELHRHEAEDEPAHSAWMYATFPALLSELRDLHQRVQGKLGIMARVESYAFHVGRSPQWVWQEFKGEPPAAAFDDDAWEEEADKAEMDAQVRELILEMGLDPGSAEADALRQLAARRDESPQADEQVAAKEIHRRLVQRLHPDRGGPWTPQREALWHEVQQAWEARDADWLSRLESELDITQDTLTSRSPLGRLRAALREVEAARRDVQRKLRAYRKSPAWKFTTRGRSAAEVRRAESQLRQDLEHLTQQLEAIERTLAAWSRPMGQARARREKVGV